MIIQHKRIFIKPNEKLLDEENTDLFSDNRQLRMFQQWNIKMIETSMRGQIK